MIAIIGAGAIGRGLGSCLLASGESLLFVTRSEEGASPLREEGLRRTGIFGNRSFGPGSFEASASLETLRGREIDTVLVCTKTRDAEALAPGLANVLDDAGGPRNVVLCLNGWGSHEAFAAKIAPERIFNAVVITGFRCVGGAGVDITVHADPVRIGSTSGAAVDAIRPLCESITRGDLPCEPSASIESELWAKMLYNCALNPLGALIGVSYGVLGERAETRSIITAVVAEIFGVLEVAGIRTRWPNAAAYLQTFWNELLPATASHESSMLQDLRAGRRTEIGALTGAVSELARSHGFQTPVCNALTCLVSAREEKLARLN